jgi:hypothetical protein
MTETTTTKSAEQRVAEIRKESAAIGEPLDHLSDLDVLNQVFEIRERETINTRDRYMGLLVAQRKHGEAVRAAVWQEARSQVDSMAVRAVERLSRDLTSILSAVEVLPARPDAARIERLKEIATTAKHMLRLRDDNPTQVWRLDDNATLVRQARSVVGVLGGRDGVPADEVIRLVGEALKPDGNLKDLFVVADRHPRPDEQPPPFMGEHWSDRNSYFAYEPDGDGARVVAYNLGDAWHLDLYSVTGRLLAYGVVAADEVAAYAPVLVARAAEWAADRDGYPWRRFADLTQAMQPARAA